MLFDKSKLPFHRKYRTHQVLCRTVGQLASIILPPPQKVVIITNGRTGSNLLVSYLNSSPDVRAYGEVFGTYYLSSDFLMKRLRQPGGVVRHLREMLRRSTTEKITAVKMLYQHFDERFRKRQELPELSNVLPELQHDPEVKIIHLRRENLLDVVVSNMLAKQSGNYVGKSYNIEAITVPPRVCRRQFMAIEERENYFRQAFPTERYLELTYEGLTEQPEETLAKVETFLGIENLEARSHIQKQNRASKIDVIANYDELHWFFRRSEYRRFFDASRPLINPRRIKKPDTPHEENRSPDGPTRKNQH